jgi:hypothetical protein
VPKTLGVKSAKELNAATVCVAAGTTTELNLADYFRANKMTFKPVVIERVDQIRALPTCRRPEPRRLPDPSGNHLQGAAGPGRASRRPPVRAKPRPSRSIAA